MKKLTEWQQANLLDAQQVQAIRAYEDAQPSATHFIWRHGLLSLGILTIAIGLLAIVASNWNAIPATVKLSVHVLVNLGVGGTLFYYWQRGRHREWAFEAGLCLKSVLVLTLMALLGQILQTQSPLEDTLLLWWMLITPMILLLGRYRMTYLLWTILSVTLICMRFSIGTEPFTFFGLLIGVVQLYILLPLFQTWRDAKPDWSLWGRKHGLMISVIVMNLMLLAPLGYWHASQYMDTEHSYLYSRAFADKDYLTMFGWELAVAGNLLLTWLLLAIRHNTLSPIRLLAKSDSETRIAAAHLLIGLFLAFVPSWFGWFILYWLGVGYTALRHDHRRLVGLAITVLAVRIIAFYFILTHSLMTTGILMIASGLGVVYMVKTYPRWRAAILSVTGEKR